MTVLTVGVGKTYSTIAAAVAAAKDGDTLDVDAGTYTNDYASISKNITLQGVGGTVHLVSTGLIPNGKGIFVVTGNITVNNFEFSGAQVADHNGAGIRMTSGNLVLNDCYFHDNENGVLTGNTTTDTLTINNSEFASNGRGDGQTHNLYTGKIASLTINNSYFHDAIEGHEIKSRALSSTITNSRIYDLNSTASYSIDLPDGGNALIRNNVIEQGPQSHNYVIIAYGEEKTLPLNPGTNFVINGNTILNDKSGSALAVLNQTATATTQITSNKFFGLTSNQIVSGPNVQSGNQFLATEPSLDTAHPWASPSALSIGLVSDTGSSATDGITLNPALKGTGQANTAVTIKEGSTTLGTTTVDSMGAWSFTPPDLIDGTHILVASEIDAGGNTGTATLNFTLDRTVPTVSMALVSDTGSSSTDGITSNPALKGTGQANTTVTIKEGSTTLGTATADSTGAWSFTPTGLIDGTYNFVATQTDLAGNTGSASLSFTLDSNLDPGALTGTEGDDVLTGTSPGLNVIYGLGGNDTISVQYGNATTKLYGGAGNDMIKGSAWNKDYIEGGSGNDIIFSYWGDDTILGGDGNDYINAGSGNDVIYGGAGNDTIYADWGDDIIYDEEGVNRIDGGPGTDTVVFSGNYADYSLTAANGVATVAGSQGTSTLTHIEKVQFKDGSYDVLTGLFMPDGTAPTVSLALVSDTGSSSTDGITSNPAVKGTGQANTVVTIKEGTTTLGTTTADSTGAWSFTPTGLADGLHMLTATQTDLAGNTGTMKLSFTLDKTATDGNGTNTTTTDSGIVGTYYAGAADGEKGYDIRIDFKGAGWTDGLEKAVTNTADYFTKVITADIGGGQYYNNIYIDDLYIVAELKPIDGIGGLLGQGGPTSVWSSSDLTKTGSIQFDTADALNYFKEGLWDDIVTHEMMHVLGFGTLWNYGTDLLVPTAGQYVGKEGLAAYQAAGHPNATYIPVQTSGGAGTAGAHWSEAALGNELMTPYINGSNYLSSFSLMSLADLGYSVQPLAWPGNPIG